MPRMDDEAAWQVLFEREWRRRGVYSAELANDAACIQSDIIAMWSTGFAHTIDREIMASMTEQSELAALRAKVEQLQSILRNR